MSCWYSLLKHYLFLLKPRLQKDLIREAGHLVVVDGVNFFSKRDGLKPLASLIVFFQANSCLPVKDYDQLCLDNLLVDSQILRLLLLGTRFLSCRGGGPILVQRLKIQFQRQLPRSICTSDDAVLWEGLLAERARFKVLGGKSTKNAEHQRFVLQGARPELDSFPAVSYNWLVRISFDVVEFACAGDRLAALRALRRARHEAEASRAQRLLAQSQARNLINR